MVFFVTKLHGFIDVSTLVLFLFLFWSWVTYGSLEVNRALVPHFSYLFILVIYAGLISSLYGVQEVIFFLKFSRTLLSFFLLYFAWKVVSSYIGYELFLKYLALMIVFHSLVVILCVFFSDVRDVVYSITGYVPSGPAWSRSPGLTISFNTPSILHVLGLWILLTRRYWPFLVRVVFGFTVLFSLIFMGRTIAFVGILIIMFYFLVLERRWFFTSVLGVFLMSLLSIYDYVGEYVGGAELGQSLHHFMEPLKNMGSYGGVDSYFSDTLIDHIYFSDDASTIIFGNSRAGHIGVIDRVGETNSDLGVINSINANGLLITLSMYCFYLIIIWQVRKSDWKTVSIVAFLCMALTFKETGFFTSHATPVMFFLFFYNIFSKRYIVKTA